MLRIISMSFISIFFINIVCAQKSFDVTIRFDSSINAQKVQYQYYDGKNLTILPDTFGNKKVIVFKSKYYSPFASFNISYTGPDTYYDNYFFLNDKPAIISFYDKPNNEHRLNYNFIQNAVPIYDTTANKAWAGLRAFMVDTIMTKENKAFDSFLSQNKGFSNNDSLKRIFNKFYKARLNRIISYLKKYPEDYFSFWYFIQQVAQPNGALRKDTTYLKEQLAYLKTIFPKKYTGSIEGKELIKNYEAVINPLKLNETALPFIITTIDGKKISLKDLKGKYVLLDFWATWCPPCLAEMPFIKEIRKNYPSEKLVIIGISWDHDLKPLNAMVKKQGMDWPQFFDRNQEIGRLYSVSVVPTLILIDKEGKMVYKSNDKQNDQDRLPKVLADLN